MSLFKIVERFLDFVYPNNALMRAFSTESLDSQSSSKECELENMYKFNFVDKGCFIDKTISFCEDEFIHNFSIYNTFMLNTSFSCVPMQHAYCDDLDYNYVYSENVVFLINPTYGYRIICNKDFLKYLDFSKNKTTNMEQIQKFNFYDDLKEVMRQGPDILVFTGDIHIKPHFIDHVIGQQHLDFEDPEFQEYMYNLSSLNNYVKDVLYNSINLNDEDFHYYNSM